VLCGGVCLCCLVIDDAVVVVESYPCPAISLFLAADFVQRCVVLVYVHKIHVVLRVASSTLNLLLTCPSL
jgi:hypothetical protein